LADFLTRFKDLVAPCGQEIPPSIKAFGNWGLSLAERPDFR